MIKKVDFKSLFLNPIDGFYKHIMSNLNEIVDSFFDDEFKDTKPNYNLIQNCDLEISNIKEEIKQRKNKDKISSRYTVNSVIFFLFFFLIGFLMLPIYLVNNRIINDFSKYHFEKKKRISELVKLKCEQIYYSFTTITLRDIYSYVFEKLGMKVLNNFNQKEILNLINDKDVIDIYSGMTGIVNNTPFYDVIARKLVYKSNSLIPSEKVVSGHEINEKFKLTNNNGETTINFYVPVIEEKNLLIFKTNFLSDLTIANNSAKYESNNFFENKEFSEKVKVVDYTNNKEDTLQFFTLRAQDNFVKWYNFQNQRVFDFVKIYDNFVVKNYTYDFNNLRNINKTIDSIVAIRYDSRININMIKNAIKKNVFDYFDRFAKMLQLPLLVPGIAREWYRNDGNYLIATESDFAVENIDDITNLEPIDSIDKFMDEKYYNFTNGSIPKVKIWFTQEKVTKTRHNCLVGRLMMHSFSVQKKTTSDYIDGQTTEYSYNVFSKIQEKKYLITLYKRLKTRTIFIIGKTLSKLISQNHYVNKDFFENVLKNNIWTNDPLDFEHSPNSSILFDIANQFNELNNKYDLNACLRLDDSGLYVSIDNTQKINDSIIDEVIELIYRISQLNYMLLK